MFFFGNRKRMEILDNFVPTSKVQLKRFCFAFHNGDSKKAQEMYDYFAEGLNLPDVDPVPPSMMEKIKNGVMGITGFVKENQDDIVNAYNLIQHIVKNKGAIPLPNATPTEPLPPINT